MPGLNKQLWTNKVSYPMNSMQQETGHGADSSLSRYGELEASAIRRSSPATAYSA